MVEWLLLGRKLPCGNWCVCLVFVYLKQSSWDAFKILSSLGHVRTAWSMCIYVRLLWSLLQWSHSGFPAWWWVNVDHFLSLLQHRRTWAITSSTSCTTWTTRWATRRAGPSSTSLLSRYSTPWWTSARWLVTTRYPFSTLSSCWIFATQTRSSCVSTIMSN